MTFQLIFSDLSSSSLLQIQIFVRENMIEFSRVSYSLFSQSAVAEAYISEIIGIWGLFYGWEEKKGCHLQHISRFKPL